MAIYVNTNNKVTDMFININGSKKKIISAWVHGVESPRKVFDVSSTIDDPYDIAPADAYSNWDYTLDNVNDTITLNYYTGSETDVIVYANYIIGEKTYKTLISSFPNNTYSDYMFSMYGGSYCKSITRIRFSDYIDTSNVTDMTEMFLGCENLMILHLGNFDVSNVTKMRNMFASCKRLTSLDLRGWDTSNVTDMRYMFNADIKLTEIFVTNGKWKTTQANTDSMFLRCGTSSVTYK